MAGYRLINGKMVWDPNYNEEGSGVSLDMSGMQRLRQKYAADIPGSQQAEPVAAGASQPTFRAAGLAGGAATGATIGAGVGSIVPGVGNVVGGAAGAGVGALIDAFGSGMEAEDADKEKKRLEAIALKQQQFNNKMDLRRAAQTDRQMNQSGLDYLANTRQNAIGQFRNLLYRS